MTSLASALAAHGENPVKRVQTQRSNAICSVPAPNANPAEESVCS